MTVSLAAMLVIAIGLQSNRIAEPALEFHLTKAAQTVPVIDPLPITQPEITLATETPNVESSIMVEFYTDDPDVVIYWFGD